MNTNQGVKGQGMVKTAQKQKNVPEWLLNLKMVTELSKFSRIQ